MAGDLVYMVANGVNPTTAVLAPVATGTIIKSHVQIATPSTKSIKVVAWGLSFDTPGSASLVKAELIICDVAATVTSVTPSKWACPNDELSLCIGGAALTGHTATAEGTVGGTTLLDYQQVIPPDKYVYEFSLGREPMVPASKFLRIRMIASVTCNVNCWVRYAE